MDSRHQSLGDIYPRRQFLRLENDRILPHKADETALAGFVFRRHQSSEIVVASDNFDGMNAHGESLTGWTLDFYQALRDRAYRANVERPRRLPFDVQSKRNHDNARSAVFAQR